MFKNIKEIIKIYIFIYSHSLKAFKIIGVLGGSFSLVLEEGTDYGVCVHIVS